MSKLDLTGVTPSLLNSLIEQNYYRACVMFKEVLPEKELNDNLCKLISDIRTIEQDAVSQELYELAVVCRDRNNELVNDLDLCISI